MNGGELPEWKEENCLNEWKGTARMKGGELHE